MEANNKHNETGWLCPVCRRSVNPRHDFCPDCSVGIIVRRIGGDTLTIPQNPYAGKDTDHMDGDKWLHDNNPWTEEDLNGNKKTKD